MSITQITYMNACMNWGRPAAAGLCCSYAFANLSALPSSMYERQTAAIAAIHAAVLPGFQPSLAIGYRAY